MRLKKIIGFGFIIASLGTAVLSCSKNGQDTVTAPVDMDLTGSSIFQFYNATINVQRNYLYVDGKPVTGAVLVYTSATTTNLFPGLGSGFAVPAGVRNFTIKDTLTTSAQPVLGFINNVDANKRYTIFSYDTATAIKQKTVETIIETPADSTSRVRLAHFAYLSTGPTPAIDVFSKRLNTNIFTNVAYTDVTGFIPYASANSHTTGLLTDTLLVRQTGNTTTNLDTMVFNPTQRFSYTLIFRGRYASAGTAAIPRALVSFSNN